MPQPTHLNAVRRNALALRDNGDPVSARLMLQQALEAAKVSLDEDHPEVLSTAHLLATIHWETGEPAAARRVLEEAVAAGRLRYGDAEPIMLALSYTLGAVADELGNRHEARRNFGRVATAGPAVLGEDHDWVRTARDYLAGAVAAGATAPAWPAPAPASPEYPPPEYPPPEYPPPEYPQSEYPQSEPVAPVSLCNATPAEPVAHSGAALPRTHRAGAPAPRGRGPTVAASIAAAAAVVAVALAAIMMFQDDPAQPPSAGEPGVSVAPSPAASAAAPEQVRVSDDGNEVTLSWTDPTDGTVPFLVTGGQPGAQQRILADLPAGATRRVLNGLNPKWDYCFTVVAVYTADTLVPSDQVCTRRLAKASPTGPRR